MHGGRVVKRTGETSGTWVCDQNTGAPENWRFSFCLPLESENRQGTLGNRRATQMLFIWFDAKTVLIGSHSRPFDRLVGLRIDGFHLFRWVFRLPMATFLFQEATYDCPGPQKLANGAHFFPPALAALCQLSDFGQEQAEGGIWATTKTRA